MWKCWTLYLCIIIYLKSPNCLLIVCKLCVSFVCNIYVLSFLCSPLGQVSFEKEILISIKHYLVKKKGLIKRQNSLKAG